MSTPTAKQRSVMVVTRKEDATQRLGLILAHVLRRKEPVAVMVLEEDGTQHTYWVSAVEAPNAQA